MKANKFQQMVRWKCTLSGSSLHSKHLSQRRSNGNMGGFENGQVLSQTWTSQHWLCGWGEGEGRGSHFALAQLNQCQL